MDQNDSLFLQFWGGLFYLLNKIFFAVKESRPYSEVEKQQFWRILAWVTYLIGAPAWLVILYHEDKLMTFLVELGGIPSMVLGLVIALRLGSGPMSEKWKFRMKALDWFAWSSAIVGIMVSFYFIGFMTEFTQWLELGIVFGFLVGTYRLAHDRLDGYLCFLVMNGSAGWLVFVEGYPILGFQQILSLGFVLYAFIRKKNSRRS